MSVLNHDQLLAKIKERLGEDVSDEGIAFVEDITDTLNHYEEVTKDNTDWKQKYEENDNEWRKKYKERFFSGRNDKEDEEEGLGGDDEAPKKYSYENLFKEGKK